MIVSHEKFRETTPITIKNAVNNIEQVIKAAPHKAAAVWLPTIHHENYPF